MRFALFLIQLALASNNDIIQCSLYKVGAEIMICRTKVEIKTQLQIRPDMEMKIKMKMVKYKNSKGPRKGDQEK